VALVRTDGSGLVLEKGGLGHGLEQASERELAREVFLELCLVFLLALQASLAYLEDLA
jgi:hypothetical protein